METEKIYYAVIILLCAASMLLSPFLYQPHAIGRRITPRTSAMEADYYCQFGDDYCFGGMVDMVLMI